MITGWYHCITTSLQLSHTMLITIMMSWDDLGEWWEQERSLVTVSWDTLSWWYTINAAFQTQDTTLRHWPGAGLGRSSVNTGVSTVHPRHHHTHTWQIYIEVSFGNYKKSSFNQLILEFVKNLRWICRFSISEEISDWPDTLLLCHTASAWASQQ